MISITDGLRCYYNSNMKEKTPLELEKENRILQSNWNSLREWLEEQHQFIIEIPAYTKEISTEHKTMEICYENVLDKMNELEGKDNNGK